MARRLLLLALLAPGLAAPSADAAVVTGSTTDPAGDAPAAGVDMTAAAWRFDDATGFVQIAVTLAAAPDVENWGVINAAVRTACDGSTFATVRGNARTSSVSASVGSAEDGVQPDGSSGPSTASGFNEKSDEGRTTTMGTEHARLVGRSAGCVTITMTHNGTLDAMVVPMTAVTGTPAPPYAVPDRPSAVTANPRDVRLGTGRRLRFRKSRARLALTGLAAGMRTRLRLRLENGTTLATGRYVARASHPALVTLKLTKKGRRWLRTHRRGGRARLTVRTTLAGSSFQRRYAMRVR